MQRVVKADCRLAEAPSGRDFTPTEELNRDAERAQELNLGLVERLRVARALRPDVELNDRC
jgi:hypothetical protein